VMAGFCVRKQVYEAALEEISQAITDPLLPLYEFQEALSPIGGRIDQALYQKLCKLLEDYRGRVEGHVVGGSTIVDDFPAL
jgi:hypothetical protein